MNQLTSLDLVQLYWNIIDIIHDFYTNMNLLNKKQIYSYFQKVKGWFNYYHGKMELNNKVIDHKIFYTDKEFNDMLDSHFEEIRKNIDGVIYFRYKFMFHPEKTERFSLTGNEEINNSNIIERNNDNSIVSNNINIDNISNTNNTNLGDINDKDLDQDNISDIFFNLETKKQIFMLKIKKISDKLNLIEIIKDNKYKFEEVFYIYNRKGQFDRNWYFYIKTKYVIHFPFNNYKQYEYYNLEISRKEKRDHILSFGNKVDII